MILEKVPQWATKGCNFHGFPNAVKVFDFKKRKAIRERIVGMNPTNPRSKLVLANPKSTLTWKAANRSGEEVS